MKIKFEPRDIWIGIFWTVHYGPYMHHKWLSIYLCIIPMFPMIFTFRIGEQVTKGKNRHKK